MPARDAQSGFTLVELITVMILIGILAVVATPRLGDSGFRERGFRDAVVAAVSHARLTAVASRRFVCVTLVPGTGPSATLSIARDVADPDTNPTAPVNCAAAVPLPAPSDSCGATNQVCAPSGVALGGTTSLIFDPLGTSVTSAKTVTTAAIITVSNQPNVTLQSDTGYVE
jgi:MSHA pilin protein MshC